MKKVAKSAKAEPVESGPDPSTGPTLKRGRGRPRKNPLDAAKIQLPVDTKSLANQPDDAKALTVFRRALADAEKLQMSAPDFDGGGTPVNTPTVTKESLQRRVSRRLAVLDRFLTDDKLIELLALSSLKEVGIYEGILLDKSLVLQGQPNVIIGDADRSKIDVLLPKLVQELKRRNIIATERSIEFKP